VLLRRESHRDAPFGHELLGLLNGELAEVENTGSQRRVGMA
jgi:hypothetical protein